MEESIRCHCGKLVAKRIEGKIYVYCKQCKKQIPIE